jgi:PadR family transcriptional regulator PadR
MDRQMSSEELRELVLGILVRREAYGVEIAAALASRLPSRSEDADLPEGSVYPALRWLERHGLAVSHWVDLGQTAPRRRYYCLTAKGKRVSARHAVAGPNPQPFRSVTEVRS